MTFKPTACIIFSIMISFPLISSSHASDKILDDEWGVKTNALATPFAKRMYSAMTDLHNAVKSNREGLGVRGKIQALMGTMSGGENAPAATDEEMRIASASINFMARFLQTLQGNVNLQSFIGLDSSVNHQYIHNLLGQRSDVYKQNVVSFASRGVKLVASNFSSQNQATLSALSQMIDNVTKRWKDNGLLDENDGFLPPVPFANQMNADTLHNTRLDSLLALYADTLRNGKTLF